MSIDRLVVFRSAAHGLLLGAPAALVNVVLAGQDPAPEAALNATLLALLVAFAISGYMAGRFAPDAPAGHGALAGLVTFALVQVIGILGRLDREAGIPVGQIIVLALISALVASGAAGLGARRPSPPPATST